jgi:polyisoprenoid-binding protein YceI
MNWKIDTQHTDITFTVRHMMIANVRGQFEEIEGKVDFNSENPEESSVDVKIKADSINTREKRRDEHLRSADFLDAENHPYMHFKSKRIEVIDKKHGKIYGDLTIRDQPREVVLDVTFNGMVKSPYGGTVAGFSAMTTLNRKDWGLAWNMALEAGGVMVGDEIKVSIDIEILEVTEEQAESVTE